MIDELLEDDNDQMSEWELKFIIGVNDNMGHWMENYKLTPLQKEMIEEIWGKVFR